MHFDGVLAKFGSKVIADVADVLEDEDDRVYGIVRRTVIVIGIG